MSVKPILIVLALVATTLAACVAPEEPPPPRPRPVATTPAPARADLEPAPIPNRSVQNVRNPVVTLDAAKTRQ